MPIIWSNRFGLSWEELAGSKAGRRRKCHLLKSSPNYQISFFPHFHVGAGLAQDGKTSPGKESSVCISIMVTHICLIHLIGLKLSPEWGRELQSIGLNSSLYSHCFILLHQLYVAIKTNITPPQLSLVWGNPSPDPSLSVTAATEASWHEQESENFPADVSSVGQSCGMMLLLSVPPGQGCAKTQPGVEAFTGEKMRPIKFSAWKSSCPETALLREISACEDILMRWSFPRHRAFTT